MIKNVIIDIDGTLAETYSDIIRSLNFSLKKEKIKKKIDLKKFKSLANNGSKKMIMKLIGRKKSYLINDLNNLFINHYRKNICIKSKLKKNALLFLKYCKKNKINLFVSTNKSEENAKLLLKKLKVLKYFKFTAGHDTFNYKKPNPLHLDMLKKKFKIKKKQTIYIGDSEIDSLVARKFKIKFFLIKKGYTNISHLKIFSDYTFSNFTEIPSLIKKLS